MRIIRIIPVCFTTPIRAYDDPGQTHTHLYATGLLGRIGHKNGRQAGNTPRTLQTAGLTPAVIECPADPSREKRSSAQTTTASNRRRERAIAAQRGTPLGYRM